VAKLIGRTVSQADELERVHLPDKDRDLEDLRPKLEMEGGKNCDEDR
jgi:hypothetical protein